MPDTPDISERAHRTLRGHSGSYMRLYGHPDGKPWGGNFLGEVHLTGDETVDTLIALAEGHGDYPLLLVAFRHEDGQWGCRLNFTKESLTPGFTCEVDVSKLRHVPAPRPPISVLGGALPRLR